MRKLTEIIIHCTATRPEWMAEQSLRAKRDEIRRWHVEDNGWRDIGYHFLIDRDGALIEGRPIVQIGAHTRGQNTHSIGIALIGGHGGAETDQFKEHFTEAQDLALRELISKLQAQHGPLNLSGHNQYAPIARILLRYIVGAALMGSETIGNQLATDPDAVFITAAFIGATVETLYMLAKKWEWKT